MIGDARRRSWRSIPAASRSARVRRTSTAPAVESLEGRQLLSTFTGFTHVRNILTPAGIFSLQVTGPGVLKASPAGHGAINLNVLGTTTNSSLSITQVQPRFHVVSNFLVIQNLTIKSGQIGNIQASPAELDGPMTLPMTPLITSINTLQFGALGPNAQIDVNGSVGSMSVQNDVNLGPSGHVVITGNLNSLTVTGNLLVSPGSGGIVVGGNLNGLTVNGIFQGQGTSAIDLSVGLDLTNFTVLGGASGLGGVRSANIAVGKDIVGLNIQHGIFNSLITAGVLIDGSPQNTSSGGNIGPDGSDAIFDSEILAGVQIDNLLINGNVTSDYVTNPKPNPTGYPTRIVAGEVLEDRAPGRNPQGGFPQGTFTSGGNIDNFQILGALIDSVVAASVAPFGGNGTLPYSNGFEYSLLPPSVAPTPGEPGTYDAPGGFIIGGTVGISTSTTPPVLLGFPNFSEVSYYNETEISTITPYPPISGKPIAVTFPPPRNSFYNKTLTPSPDNTILFGAINPSFATAPANLTATNVTPGTSVPTTTTITLSLPSKSTVLGGVISNPHTPEPNDYAGFFANDTRGVFVGVLPTSS
jgi:hypothetical protein